MFKDKKYNYMAEMTIYFVFVFVWYMRQYLSWNGDYLDTDNYFHALRLIEAFDHGYWFEHVFVYTNYPFGEVSHWTRALDIVWFILALPFLLFYQVRDAVFYSGLLITPLFFSLGVFYLLKAGRFFLSIKYRFLTAVLILIQANVMRVVVLNRPDHHAALFFLTAYLFYKILKFIKKGRIKDLTVAAIMASFSLWMAAEGIFLFLTTASFLFYGVCFLGYQYKNFARFCFVYALGCTFFFAINPPYQGYLFIDNGRLSLFYVMAFWFLNAVILVGGRFEPLLKKIVILSSGGLILIGVYYGCGWLLSPLDERLVVPFISRISEMTSGNIYTMAYPSAALICAVTLFRQYKNNGQFIFLLINLLLFSILTAISMRFLPYSGVYAAFMLSFFVSLANRKKFWTICFVSLEFVTFTIHALFTEMKPVPVLTVPADELTKLPQGTIATELFYAPYIIWFGGHSVIASPYHRNVEGILDNHRIFFSSDENEVKALIKKHQVKYIFLPVGLDETYYQNPLKNCDKLYGQILGCHNYPQWLKVLHQGDDYYLFEVQNI